MLKFLATLGGEKPRHPLTDMHTISQWVDSLPMGDAVATVDQLAAQVREFVARRGLATKESLAVLTTLDERAQPTLEILRQQYLQNPRMSRAMESRLWNGVYAYYQEILHAYHRLVMEYIGNPSGSKITASVPLLTARLIQYFSLDARWSYYRYTDTNPKLWKRLHNLYHFAEYEEFDRRELVLYPDEAPTHVTSLYLNTLMLETLNTGSLTPRQMHLVERWLPMLTHGIRIERELAPGRHVFYVNLSENRGARRLRRTEPTEHHRYWDTQGLKDLLDMLRSQLSAGAVPARLGLTEDCRLPACMDLLDHIALQWSPSGVKRVQRVHERKRVIKSIEVVRGLGDIAVNVRADNVRMLRRPQATARDVSYEEMVDVHLYGFVTTRTQQKLSNGPEEKIEYVMAHERWVMENESDEGYGAHIDDQADDWVRLGKLVGLKPERKAHWNVGVIRRLRRVNPSQQYVGIEVIAERPIALALRPAKKESRAMTIDGIDPVGAVLPASGLYLKGGGKDGADCLIMQSAEYAKHRELWFNFNGHIYQIRLSEVLERGDDWLRIGFTVLAKEAISAEAAPSRI